jgi:hypothetical protein
MVNQVPAIGEVVWVETPGNRGDRPERPALRPH